MAKLQTVEIKASPDDPIAEFTATTCDDRFRAQAHRTAKWLQGSVIEFVGASRRRKQTFFLLNEPAARKLYEMLREIFE